MRASFVLLCGLLVLVLGTAHGAKVSPVQKVIELLDDLKGKVASDLAAEEAQMGEYTKFCEHEASEKGYAIQTAKRKAENLQATIDEASAQQAAAESEIAKLSSDIAKKETEFSNAMKLREAEHSEFKHTESDLIHAEDELHKAEVVIKREMSFVQVKGQPKEKMTMKGMRELTSVLSSVLDATWVNTKSRSALKGFLQQQAGEADEDRDLSMNPLGAPDAKNYENHSGGIVETVKELEVKDEEQLTSTRKQEMENQHAFDMIKMSMEDAINVLKKRVAKDTKKKAALAQSIGAANGELAEVQKSEAADEEYLKNLNTDCSSKAAEWEVRQKDGADEMAAIEKAKEILATGVKVFVQTGAKSRKGDDDDEDETREKVEKVLTTLGHKFNSFAMMEIASAAASDPFEKVKGLIGDMIAQLMDAAAQEADHKAFCDEELGKSRKAKDDKARRMDQYRTRIDEAATTKAELENAVKELQAEIAEIDAAQAEASKLRTNEHEAYLKASGDFKQSAEAVEKAMTVLSEYYGKSAALVQINAETKQPTLGSKTGSDTASTILSILEVSASDFTKLLAECEAAEEEAAAAFTKLSDENRVAKAAKLAEVQGKNSEVKSLKVALTHHNEDYKSTSHEYDAVLAYLDKLKPECEAKVMTYAEKKARREQEIDGLREALAIIEGRSVPVELVQTAPDQAEEVKKEFAQNIQIHDAFANMEEEDVKKEKKVKADKDLSQLQK